MPTPDQTITAASQMIHLFRAHPWHGVALGQDAPAVLMCYVELVPTDADDEYMTAAKFLKIFEKVRGMVPLDLDAEIRVEYGDDNFFPSAYHVRSVTHDQTTTRVLLRPPDTTCKARDRRVPTLPTTDSCCAPPKEA